MAKKKVTTSAKAAKPKPVKKKTTAQRQAARTKKKTAAKRKQVSASQRSNARANGGGAIPERKQLPEWPKGLTVKQRHFLNAYCVCACVATAATAAEVDRSAHYVWISRGGVYLDAWEQAQRIGSDTIEAELYRRAVNGVRKMVIRGGQPVMLTNPETGKEEPLYELEYSDNLMLNLIRARRPEYQKHTHSKVEQQTTVKGERQPDLSKLSDAELDQYMQLHAKVLGEDDGGGPS